MLELQEPNTKVLTQQLPDERDVVMLARDFALSKSVEEVEGTMLGMPQAEAQVVHRFGPGIYIREVIIPAGILAVGHRQRFEHMNVMLKGRVTVFNDNGTTTELVAPMVFVGKPGRKIGYVHEEMVWQNIYATTETDIEKLEATYLEKSDTWAQDQKERAEALALRYEADRQDYLALLAEVGIPHEIARAQSENTDDQIPMPLGSYSMMVADSPIEGKGVFATANISEGAVIAPARIDGKRTPAGRYTNHSVAPNAIMVKRPNGDIDLVATRQIAGCTGGQPGEEITIDYRQALRLSGIGSLE
jgi:hypothetical protein